MRTILSFAIAASFLGFTIAACGDVYADPEGPEQPLPPTPKPEAGVGSTVFPNEVRGECPASRPRENSSCGIAGTTCEYGASSDSQCNSTLACFGGDFQSYWDLRPADRCSPKTCPKTLTDIAALDGKPCTIELPSDADGGVLTTADGAAPPPITSADEAVCNMTDGICACTTGRDGAAAHERKWVCVKPISVCPVSRPLAGTKCAGSLWCDYGGCAFKRGLVMECSENKWQTAGAPCQ